MGRGGGVRGRVGVWVRGGFGSEEGEGVGVRGVRCGDAREAGAGGVVPGWAVGGMGWGGRSSSVRRIIM